MRSRKVHNGKLAKTKLSTAEVRATIARMEREGHTQKEIGAALGITAPAVNYHIRKMKEEYQHSMDSDLTMMRYERNLELEDVKAKVRRDYELSRVRFDEDLGEIEVPGDPSYVKLYLDAIKAQRELNGLDAAIKVDQRQATVNINVPGGVPLTKEGAVDWDAMAGRPEVKDPVEQAVKARLGGEQRALPPSRNGKHKEEEQT